jgi:hypothetical protein
MADGNLTMLSSPFIIVRVEMIPEAGKQTVLGTNYGRRIRLNPLNGKTADKQQESNPAARVKLKFT